MEQKRGLGISGAFKNFRIFFAAADAVGWVAASSLAMAIRFEFSFRAVDAELSVLLGVLLGTIGISLSFSSGIYGRRYTVGSLDETRILAAVFITTTSAVGILGLFFANDFLIPRSVPFIAGLLALFFSLSFRVVMRTQYTRRELSRGDRKKVLVYGAGNFAEVLIPQLLDDRTSPFVPVALIDDAREKKQRVIRGIKVEGKWDDFSLLAEKHAVEGLIVAIPSATVELLSTVYSAANSLDLKVFVVPRLSEFLRGLDSVSTVREIGIEDLLRRQSIRLDEQEISNFILDKKILITGAGGSIGSELVRQVIQFKPRSIMIADRDESSLTMVLVSCAAQFPDLKIVSYLCDVKSQESVEAMFKSATPDVVFHAAALKHVTFLERFPKEGWAVNVEGTRNVLVAAERFDTQTLVNISTDKAADPANVLGRSKLLGERMTAWFSRQYGRRFVSVRFGNVFGSRGSLIPIIAEQIKFGGPVTLTDPAATRYFMSITEACQLVLQAAARSEIGQTLVLDMGQPIKIEEVARRLMSLLGKTVPIDFIGLREGEKLHEELHSKAEHIVPTSHDKVSAVYVEPFDPNSLDPEELS